jgi:hypothetical protein
MKKEDLERVVRRDMPGYRLARKAKPRKGADARRARPASAAGTPDLDTLRRKYLARGTGSRGTAGAADATRRAASIRRPADSDGDDEIVAIEPEAASHPWDRAARPKAVVVSARDKRIVGKQG